MQICSSIKTRRDGIAAFELVVLLPTILALLWVIFWFGFALINKNELIVEARTKAWDQRYAEEADRTWESLPLLVLMLPTEKIDLKPLPSFAFHKQFITETNSKKVSELTFFKDWTEVNSKHVVLAGSWDHTEMDMSKPPTFGLPSGKWMAFASVYGKAGKLLDKASQALVIYYRAKQAKNGVDNTLDDLKTAKEQIGEIQDMYDKFSKDLMKDGLQEALMKPIRDIIAKALNPIEIMKGLIFP